MYKAGTVAEWRNLGLRGKIPDEVYQEATGIVTLLDDTFGAERDIDFEDGGFIVIAQTREDLDCFARDYVALDSPTLEYVEPCSENPVERSTEPGRTCNLNEKVLM